MGLEIALYDIAVRTQCNPSRGRRKRTGDLGNERRNFLHRAFTELDIVFSLAADGTARQNVLRRIPKKFAMLNQCVIIPLKHRAKGTTSGQH